MKPTKNRLFCPASKKPKIFFSTKEAVGLLDEIPDCDEKDAILEYLGMQ